MILAGEKRVVQVCVMHLSSSRRTFVMCFPSQKQEAFLWGHVCAFVFFGGVPHRIRYDNLPAATKPLVHGRTREEQRAFLAFRSHYLFDAHFCTPNQGQEKGGVEGSVGSTRRQYLVPMPHVASFEELNQQVVQRCERDDVRVVDRQPHSIGRAWQPERPIFRPLPAHSFECCITRQVHLNGSSQVTFETNRYSVPAEQARRELTLKASPFTVEIWAESTLLARHLRCYERERDLFDPLHYLSLLAKRPGALTYARPMQEWRVRWPASYDQLLTRLRESWPEERAVKEFIQILRLHQEADGKLVQRAIETALAYGGVHLDGVKHCLQQLLLPALPVQPLTLDDRPE